MKKIISYIAISVLLVACSKNANKQVRVTGRLMQSCETPAANKNGIIRLPGGGILSNPSTTLEFTTDENGYFKVTHDESFSQFSVRTSAAHNILEVKSLGGDEKELGEVYAFPQSASYYLYLEVDSAYTENDTLHYGNPGFPAYGTSPWLKKAGPFSNGIIDTVPKAINPSSLPASFQNSNNPTIKLNYYINEYDSWTDGDKNVYIPTSHCQEEYQDVTLKIE